MKCLQKKLRKEMEMAKNEEFLGLIKKHELSTTKLADKLGVSERAVQHWIRGRNKPSIAQLIKMGKIFHINLKKLYDMFKTNEFKI